MRKETKILVCLLVAALFLLVPASVLADRAAAAEEENGEIRDKENGRMPEPLGIIYVDNDKTDVQEEAVFLHVTENGLIVVQGQGLPYTGSVPMLPDPWVVWSNYLENAVYTTVSNTVDGYVFAGTYLNAPKVAQLFALNGGGTPEWMYNGNEFYIDAGDYAFTLAAVNNDSIGATVIKWTGPGNGTPDWTNTFAGYAGSMYGPVAVSDDGSTIAVLLKYFSTTHLLLFDADSSTPIVDYSVSDFPRNVRINSDGRFTIFRAGTDIFVYDKDSLVVRDQITTSFTSSALDISGSGDLIVYGWPSLVVMQWNGSAYQQLWSWSPGGYYLSMCAISTDGTTIVSSWYNISYTSVKVAVHLVGSPTPLWVYDYAVSSGVCQEMVRDIEITDDGSYFIVGSWGDEDNLNPEVHIFQRDSITPLYYTVDMPGSVFSVDISGDAAYATACGKHVHANVMGNGGDIVMIDLANQGIIEGDLHSVSDRCWLYPAFPNPFSYMTRLDFIIPEDAEVSLIVYDVQGRHIKTLVQEYMVSGEYSAVFDGSRLASGIYFVRFQAGDFIKTQNFVLLRWR